MNTYNVPSSVLQVFPKLCHLILSKTLLEISTLKLKELSDLLRVIYTCVYIYYLSIYLSI